MVCDEIEKICALDYTYIQKILRLMVTTLSPQPRKDLAGCHSRTCAENRRILCRLVPYIQRANSVWCLIGAQP